MFRDPFLTDNPSQKHTDRILAEAADDATDWIASEDHQNLAITLQSGEKIIESFSNGQCGQPIAGRVYLKPIDPKTKPLKGCFVLERKFGGQKFPETVEVFDLPSDRGFQSLNLQSQASGRGFYRIRAKELKSGPAYLSLQAIQNAKVS